MKQLFILVALCAAFFFWACAHHKKQRPYRGLADEQIIQATPTPRPHPSGAPGYFDTRYFDLPSATPTPKPTPR